MVWSAEANVLLQERQISAVGSGLFREAHRGDNL